jgi:hypothetical protein
MVRLIETAPPQSHRAPWLLSQPWAARELVPQEPPGKFIF